MNTPTRPPRITIELRDLHSTEELHARLMEALGFPDFYGRNWDAFWDAITGLVDMPLELHLLGWSRFAGRLPGAARQLRRCLEEAERLHPEQAARVIYGGEPPRER